MTDEELEAEHAALLAEHHALEAAHAQLHERPRDREAHLSHADNLRRHVQRLHDYIAALHERHHKR